MAYYTKPVATKWLNIFGELQNMNNFFKPENLLYLVKKTLSILCSTAFVKILSIMPYNELISQFSKRGLVKTKLQVKMNFTFDSIPLCCHLKKDILKAASSSEKYNWRIKQKICLTLLWHWKKHDNVVFIKYEGIINYSCYILFFLLSKNHTFMYF